MIKKHLLTHLLLGLLIIFSLSACTTQSRAFNRGENAFKHQDYHSAFTNLLTSAELGNADAQYAVGYMYYYGLGTAVNVPRAVYWFNQSAKDGNTASIKALKSINDTMPKEIALKTNQKSEKQTSYKEKSPKQKKGNVLIVLPNPR